MSTETTPACGGAVHTWFGLSYSSYAVLPRTLLQSMPAEWQERFVACMNEIDAAFSHVEQARCYKVEAALEVELGSLDAAGLKSLGITRRETGCEQDHEHGDWHCDSEVRFSDAERDDMTADDCALVPDREPVPHYNRGRAYVAPDLNAMREVDAR